MAILERLRTTRLDAALAAAFTLVGLVQVTIAPIASPGVGQLYVLGSTVPLAWRRTVPVQSALASSMFWLIPLDGFPYLGFVVVILQFFGLGCWAEQRTRVIGVSLVACATGVIGTLLGPEPPVAAIGSLIVVIAPVLAGRLVRHQRRQNNALIELSRELAAERSRAEEAAIANERARIAQELHDVVGHELTLIAIQAEAASAALRAKPDRAGEPIEAIRTTAHRTLAEIRSVIGVLAPTGEAVEPTTESLVELAARAQRAGIANSLSISGTPLPEQAPVSLAVHRIVRECLTNAGRHAPGEPVSLQVDWSPSEVRVRALNRTQARRATPGRGLTGMRHRAELLGGSFAAETVDGNFDVRILLPSGGAR